KYASPQGSEFRNYDNRDRGQQRGYDNRRQEGPRTSGSSPADSSEEVLLPGESLAKYRDKPVASPAAAPIFEPESRNDSAVGEETSPRPANTLPVAASGSTGVSRRFSGGLPSWLLADGAAEAGTEAASQASPAETASSSSPAAQECEPATNGADLNDDEVAALAADLAEAKHQEAAAEADAEAVVGGAVFEEEDEAEEEAEAEPPEEAQAEAASGLSPEDVAEVEAHRAAGRAEFAADVAHESAEHIVSLSEHPELQEEVHGAELDHAESEEEDPASETQSSEEHFEVDPAHSEAEAIAASTGEGIVAASVSGEAELLLPGETRSPRSGRAPSGPREAYPRHSAPRRPQLISEMLKPGEEIVIQIAKEPLGKKGARITSHVALPGRFLVYMPTVHHTGVSRKIISAENRSRLRRLVSEGSANYP